MRFLPPVNTITSYTDTNTEAAPVPQVPATHLPSGREVSALMSFQLLLPYRSFSTPSTRYRFNLRMDRKMFHEVSFGSKRLSTHGAREAYVAGFRRRSAWLRLLLGSGGVTVYPVRPERSTAGCGHSQVRVYGRQDKYLVT